MEHERAIELLREWAAKKCLVLMGIHFGKSNAMFTEGVLMEDGKQIGLFRHVAHGILNLFSPALFTLCELEQVEGAQRLSLSNPEAPDSIIITVLVSTGAPISLQDAPAWIN